MFLGGKHLVSSSTKLKGLQGDRLKLKNKADVSAEHKWTFLN